MRKIEKLLIEKIGEAAFENEKKYAGCTQAVVGAFRQLLGDQVVSEDVFKAGSGMCGGVANSGNVCGAICGGVMIISLFAGRDVETWDDGKRMFDTFQLGRMLIDHFKEKYWSTHCNGIQEKIMGRAFNTNFKEELAAFEKAGGHTEKCPEVVRTAARKTMEILINAKLLDAENYL